MKKILELEKIKIERAQIIIALLERLHNEYKKSHPAGLTAGKIKKGER